ncbi:GGDEF domain-containing protein [Leucobacter celer]|uniref:GGDEF domain-containing protein n=1 Tax=Leucobacter celer TaxID=668625 RepID=UPI0006A77AD2|nr:GGDEF domain-containing protein [Leucobacter celer]
MSSAQNSRSWESPSLNGARLFTESSERVVAYLNLHTPLTDWSVSRVGGGDQVHLHVHHDQILDVGDRVAWTESFCSRMAAGDTHVVRNSRIDPEYSDLEIAATVGAYAGYTIGDVRGGVFGVLCGVRSEPLLEGETVDEQLLSLLSEMLTTQLRLSRHVDHERHRLELAEALAQTDALTGALNRRGWDRVVADAQERLDAFGDPVAVAVVDLDDLKALNDSHGHAAGDAMIVRAAEALRAAPTQVSHVARYGGDEFMILCNGTAPSQIEAGFSAFARALSEAGVRASIGIAAAEPGVVPVTDAITAADARMYAHKRARKLDRRAPAFSPSARAL